MAATLTASARVSALVLYEQTRTTATRLVWTVVILNIRESSETVGHLKYTVRGRLQTIFGATLRGWG